jgi:hypothetical protein
MAKMRRMHLSKRTPEPLRRRKKKLPWTVWIVPVGLMGLVASFGLANTLPRLLPKPSYSDPIACKEQELAKAQKELTEIAGNGDVAKAERIAAQIIARCEGKV